jgi:Ca2+-binding EF-hand superfamily protein
MSRLFGVVLLFSMVLMPVTGCRSGSRSEKMAQRIADGFHKADMDGSGYLSYAEFGKTKIAQRSDDPQTSFNRADSNSDGCLSQAEVEQLVKAKLE